MPPSKKINTVKKIPKKAIVKKVSPQKRKRTTPIKIAAVKPHHRLRLRHWMLLWTLIALTVLTVVTIFNDVNIRLRAMNEGPGYSSSFTQQEEEPSEEAPAEPALDSATTTLDSSNSSTVTVNPCFSSQIAEVNAHPSMADGDGLVKFTVPFSTNWKNLDCALVPATTVFDGSTTTTIFGPYIEESSVRTPSIERDAWLSVETKNSSLKEEKYSLATTPLAGEIRERTINGMPVISYHKDDSGFSTNYWVAFGRTYTYRLASFGWLTDAEAIKIIESIKVTK